MTEAFTPPPGLRRGATVDEPAVRPDGSRVIVRTILFEDAAGQPVSTFRIVTDLPLPLLGCCWSCGLNVTNCRSVGQCCPDCTHDPSPGTET